MLYEKPKKNYAEIVAENNKLHKDSLLWNKVNSGLRQQLAKQAEIISVLKDCVETIAECEVGETAAKLSSKATLKRVGILEVKYKTKE